MAKKILVVEDERPLAKALELKLTHSGYEVDKAVNGRESLVLLNKKKFDLILLDIMMPDMDGFEVLKQIGDRGLKTNVIVASNLSQIEDIERAKMLGAKDYFIQSEVSLAEIVNKIKKLI